MSEWRYELTDERHPADDRLRRIRALCYVRPGVRAGDLGGYVESESNLSHSGSAWVFGSAQVFGSAWVGGSARVFGSALIEEPMHVYAISGPITPNAPRATLTRQVDGHLVAIGCWSGTVTDLRRLARSDNWPSGHGAEYRDKWRASLLDVAALFSRRIKMWEGA